MARVKVTEFSAKKLLESFLGLKNNRLFIESDRLEENKIQGFIKKHKKAILKVDQGVKKRGKQGLVKKVESLADILNFLEENSNRYEWFILEPFLEHKSEEEKYLSLLQERQGVIFRYSEVGGVEIEEHWQKVKENIIVYDFAFSNRKPNFNFIDNKILSKFLDGLWDFFWKYPICFLEINPLVIKDEEVFILDLAMEIDDDELNFYPNLGLRLVKDNFRFESERFIAQLNEKTPASLKFKVLNENAPVWLLLSGGGASIVLADSFADKGVANLIGNYGEYSGNPSTEDTYLYAKAVIGQMLRSKAEKKRLLIAGGIANFTDVYKTFKGIVKALEEYLPELKQQKVQVFVRRGGPNEEKAVEFLSNFLRNNNIYGSVLDSKRELTLIVDELLSSL